MTELRKLFDARQDMTITLASLGAGAGRHSDLENNANARPYAHVAVRIDPGTAPNADTIYTVYLLRDNGDIADDVVGTADAPYTPINASILGTLRNPGNGDVVEAIFDTRFLGVLGDTWGIGIVNETNQAFAATGNAVQFEYYITEIV